MNGLKITRRSVLKLGGTAAVTAAAGVATTQAYAAQTPRMVYLGRFGNGIAKYTQDPVTGKLNGGLNSSTGSSLTWLALSGNTLYAVSEDDNQIHVFDPADLTETQFAATATGSDPCHIAIHSSGKYLYTSAYDGGVTTLHALAGDTIGAGKPYWQGTKPATGKGSNAHEAVFDPSGKFLLAADLGRSGIFVYPLKDPATGELGTGVKPVVLNGGKAGCRHLVFHPNGRFVYVANELDGTVSVCSWAAGKLRPLSSTPSNGKAGATAPGEITISADGRFVYVSNRGNANTVGVFAVSADGAQLTFVANPSSGGVNPRHLTLDPSGMFLYVANQGPDSDPGQGKVCWFPIDAKTGLPGKQPGTPLPFSGASHVLFA
jgi:6-phosphogluconolactonase